MYLLPITHYIWRFNNLKDLNLYVFSKTLELLDILNSATGFIWTDRFSEPGEFEIWCNATPTVMDLLVVGNFVWAEGSTIGIIEAKELSTDSTGAIQINIKGRTSECLLERRAVQPRIQVTGAVSTVMRKLVQENVTDPTDPNRMISIILLNFSQESVGSTIVYQKNRWFRS